VHVALCRGAHFRRYLGRLDYGAIVKRTLVHNKVVDRPAIPLRRGRRCHLRRCPWTSMTPTAARNHYTNSRNGSRVTSKIDKFASFSCLPTPSELQSLTSNTQYCGSPCRHARSSANTKRGLHRRSALSAASRFEILIETHSPYRRGEFPAQGESRQASSPVQSRPVRRRANGRSIWLRDSGFKIPEAANEEVDFTLS
jgi:hypothetical protein